MAQCPKCGARHRKSKADKLHHCTRCGPVRPINEVKPGVTSTTASSFITVTSTRKTPLFIRRSAIVAIEGFTYAPEHDHAPNHYGSLITTVDGQWGSVFHALETPDQVHGFL